MQDIFNSNILEYVKKDGIEYIQFKRLLEYAELVHCYTLKPLDFPPIYKDEKKLLQSYQLICDSLNLDSKRIVKPHQTHTNNVKTVSNAVELEQVDGVITNQVGLTLLTTSADCTSLLFYDPVNKVIGDVHSGWKWTLHAIGKIAVEKMMKEYSSKPGDIICCICPHIRKCCFEVDEDVKELFEKEYNYLGNIDKIVFKGEIVSGKQKYYIDTTEINKQILKEIGLKESNIIDSNICTKCHHEYFHSYRVEKELSGRNAAVISLKN